LTDDAPKLTRAKPRIRFNSRGWFHVLRAREGYAVRGRDGEIIEGPCGIRTMLFGPYETAEQAAGAVVL
jgi:hypothetical protein